jgi:hypothetical protein
MYPHLNLLHSPSPSTNTPLHTLYLFYSPVFHYYFSWCSKEFLSVSLLWVYFDPFNPFVTLTYPISSHPPFFISLPCISLYPLPSQMLCFMTLLVFYRSLFLSLFLQVPWSSSTITNMLYIWVCMCSCLFLCICLSFGSIFHIWEKTCSICLSEPVLLGRKSLPAIHLIRN